MSSRAAVPNLFGTRDRFRGRQICHGWGREREWWNGSGGSASYGSGGKASDAGRWRAADEASLAARRSPPAVRPGSQQAADPYQSTTWGLGTPVLEV